ncbi:phytochelatin synthase family protein [Puniceibacterium sediminis]|uniref:glutathione gamma-glutamylcysteinyltransferase n=1 Tax=Puniceibacterium sediminis TaxID=1608407 RepID=A0A238WT27_9RHOB|nr:phytochelatin synthase family protein [Puniceibacterium sediminis]SNR49503.1 Phytochelatin synthase [Puniceibacterium sediminis]
MSRTTRLVPALLALFLAPGPLIADSASGEAPIPKLGPDAVPVTADHAYLTGAAAPDYWAFSAFIKPQVTTSACSIAAVTGALNGLRGLPANSEDKITTQQQMLDLVGEADWVTLSAEGGDGVTFDQLVRFTDAALKAAEMGGYHTKILKPANDAATTLNDVRALLKANEASADDALLLYFNQGVVTGDWDGPHVAVIGAYDALADKVLILEVDQEWYIPYWTPTTVLLAAMLRPTGAEHGVLEGETGGLVHIVK